jgi:hypothetical protein
MHRTSYKTNWASFKVVRDPTYILYVCAIISMQIYTSDWHCTDTDFYTSVVIDIKAATFT